MTLFSNFLKIKKFFLLNSVVNKALKLNLILKKTSASLEGKIDEIFIQTLRKA